MAKLKTNINLSQAARDKADLLAEQERRQLGNRASRSTIIERLIHQAFDTAAPALVRAAQEDTTHVHS